MCDCLEVSIDSVSQVIGDTPCSAITIDLLRTYQRPILCVIEKELWLHVQSSVEEMKAANQVIENLIEIKEKDSGSCEGTASLAIIRTLVGKIVQLGLCI
jgi:hypothetical protein